MARSAGTRSSLLLAEGINSELLADLRDATLSRSPASLGWRRTVSTHEFYRYPARFSPDFARAAIAAFTNPGDVVMDPFVGGGTSLVEARLLGRPALGSDLNPVATFVSRVKTRLYRSDQLQELENWRAKLDRVISGRLPEPSWEPWLEAGYLRNLSGRHLAPMRKGLGQAIDSLTELSAGPVRDLARCAVLRTGQWALDMRTEVPTLGAFREVLGLNIEAMATAARGYTAAARKMDLMTPVSTTRRTRILTAAVPGLAEHAALDGYPRPTLLLMSPPYPGVYINYHRWKIWGRKETPALFWIANRRDGNGITHYTMAARSDPERTAYFKRLAAVFEDLARLCSSETRIVQMVGFSEPKVQFPRFLDAMQGAGFVEERYESLATRSDGRLWRTVPGRRWWVEAGSMATQAPSTAREVVLVHRLGGAS